MTETTSQRPTAKGQGPTANSQRPTASRRERVLVLLTLGLGMLLLAQDLASLNVALPSIERALDVDLQTAQWVVNAYLLVYGMVIVTGGRLADELGRRRVFLAGAFIFALGALAAGLAPGVGWLIAARVVMGVGAGLMLPSLTGMSYAVLPDKPELAGGIIVGAYAIGMALGPMAGGWIVEFAGWRWTQVLNVPFALLVMLGTWRTVRPIPAEERPDIDYKGILTLSAGLILLLLALDQGSGWGWGDPRIIGGLVVSAVCIALFVLFERRAGERALIPGDVIRYRDVWLACVLKVLMAPAYAAAVLYLPQIMQKLMHYSPFETGVRMLPMLGLYAVGSFLAGPLTTRFDVRLALIGGLGAMSAGAWLLSQFSVAAGYTSLVAGMALLGVGLAFFQPSVVTGAVKADPHERKSLIGGLVLMFQFVGSAIGLGFTTTIVAAAERGAVDQRLLATGVSLDAAARAALDRLLAGSETARQLLAQFDATVAQEVLGLAGDAFAAGVRQGLRIDTFIIAAGVVLAVIVLVLRGDRGQRGAGG